MPRGIPIQVKKDQIRYVLNNIIGVLKSGSGNQAGGRPQKPRESLCENKKKRLHRVSIGVEFHKNFEIEPDKGEKFNFAHF